MRKYFHDIHVERASNQRLVPVTVIGKSKAGKTSIVHSVHENRRVLTQCDSDEGIRDTATKVFKVVDTDVDENFKLIFSDFGGQKMYHFSYRLTFKKKCVPLLVIDISEFERHASDKGVVSACQELCIEWLSHLYIACPGLKRPVVVLTHCDCLPDNRVRELTQQLLKGTEELRLRIIKEEKNVNWNSNPISTMTSFTDTSQPLISDCDIIHFSSTSGQAEINRLKKALTTAGSDLITEIPGRWYQFLLKIIQRTDEPYVNLSDLEREFPDDEVHVTLEYLHETGRIMWFRRLDKLSSFVFHRSEVITSLIEILYNHTLDITWESRLDQFTPFTLSDGTTIERSRYEKMIGTFKETGVMEAHLLQHLLEEESQLPADTSIEILKTFHLVHLCGSSAAIRQQKYIIPFFATRKVTAPDVYKQLIPLKVDLYLRGLPVPSYIFSLITAAYLDMNSDLDLNFPAAGSNGATVTKSNGLINYLTHDSIQKHVTLITLTPQKKISDAWQDQLSTLKKLIENLKSVWKGVRFESVFYCSHCLLTNKLSPTTAVDPGCLSPEVNSTCYTGEEAFVCRKEVDDTESCFVPKPLMYPCMYRPVFNKEKKKLRLDSKQQKFMKQTRSVINQLANILFLTTALCVILFLEP